jgi:hypothetical protein
MLVGVEPVVGRLVVVEGVLRSRTLAVRQVQARTLERPTVK